MHGWPRHEYTLTPILVLRWARQHRLRTGRLPSARSGAAHGVVTWMAVDQAMRNRSHGWRPEWGRSLPEFKRRHFPAAEIAASDRKARGNANRGRTAHLRLPRHAVDTLKH